MTITSDLNDWWVDVEDFNESNAAKAAVQDLVNSVNGMLSQLLAMNAAGDFDSLPTSGKDAAITIFQKYNAASNWVAGDSDSQEFLDWTP